MSLLPRLRPSRRVLALTLVALLAAPLLLLSKGVVVHVDGVAHQVRTYAGTVYDLIDDQGIELAAGDRILPPPNMAVRDGQSIRILRTVSVQLIVDDHPARELRGTFRTVGGALAAAGITDLEGLHVTPGPGWPVDQDTRIVVRHPVPVTVNVDGISWTVHTTLPRVADVLTHQGVEVGDADIVQPLPETLVAGPSTITVRRVAVDEVVEEVPLDRTTERRETDDLLEGTSRVAEEGRDGLRRDVYRVRLVDGHEVRRRLVSREVVIEPQSRIVLVGTREPPPPPPAEDDSVWYRLARCESGGNWYLNGTYDGGLQFHPSTWTANRPSGYPAYAYQASPAQQITVGKIVQRRQGWGAWPHCSRQLGLR